MSSIESVASLTLDLPPSCVEFWPEHSEWAVVGTYYLERNELQMQGGAEAKRNEAEISDDTASHGENPSQHRSGSLVLLEVKSGRIAVRQSLTTPFAIFDLHFCPPSYNSPGLFGAATSTGSLSFYSILATQDIPGAAGNVDPHVKHERTLQFLPDDILVTSFSWHPTTRGIIGMTLSSGEVKLCKFDLTGCNSVENLAPQNPDNIATVLSHDLEAWTLAFVPNGLGIYTGGDDSALRYRSLPNTDEIPKLAEFSTDDILSQVETLQMTSLDEYVQEDAPSTQWADKGTHKAGVTAILPLMDGIILTGSYDDHVRVLECPEFGPRRVLLEENLGGGVWRLKLFDALSDPDGHWITTFRILASCMHAGTRIMDIKRAKDGSWSLEVIFRFEEHKSMNYASDIKCVDAENKRDVISTSFYDKLVCLWQSYA